MVTITHVSCTTMLPCSSSELLNLLKPKRADKGKTSGSGGVSSSSNSRGKSKLPADVKAVGKSASDLEALWQREEEARNKEKAKREAEEEEKRKEEERIREEKAQQEEEERVRRTATCVDYRPS